MAIEDCETSAIPGARPVNSLLHNVQAVTDAMYQNLAELKVNHDGTGTIGVLFENGRPASLRFRYRNREGRSVSIEKSFGDLANGQPLIYQNQNISGPAIVLEPVLNFRNGSTYNFNLRLRTSMNPVQYSSHQIRFDANPIAPRLHSSNGLVQRIVISPGIHFRTLPSQILPRPGWNGTFTGVEFE
jgi:hypothetical protein